MYIKFNFDSYLLLINNKRNYNKKIRIGNEIKNKED